MKFNRVSRPTSETVTLQSIGHVIGQPAKNLKVGDVTMWNFGHKSKVLEIVKTTKAFVTVKFQSLQGDYIGDRKLGLNRLVCILEP